MTFIVCIPDRSKPKPLHVTVVATSNKGAAEKHLANLHKAKPFSISAAGYTGASKKSCAVEGMPAWSMGDLEDSRWQGKHVMHIEHGKPGATYTLDPQKAYMMVFAAKEKV